MANWCSRVSPVVLEFDGVRAEAYADPERSDWIYIRFNDTTYCHWAKQAGGFELLGETSLQISDAGRTYRRRHREDDEHKGQSIKKNSGDRSLTRADLDAVVSLLPELCEAVTDRAAGPATNSHEYSSDFSSVVRQIVNEFHTRPFMYAFDYLSWMDEGRRLIDDPEGLAAADLETIRKLLVFHWRSDYWDADNEHWESITASGHLVALLDRLSEIAQTMDPEASPEQFSSASDIDAIDDSLPIVPGEVHTSAYVPPTAEEYERGLKDIRDNISDRQMRMLQAHYSAPRHSATMADLAETVGYPDYRAANSQYGRLARMLLQEMGLPAPLWRGKDPVWVLGLGNIVSETEFVMHPSLAQAIEGLGWVHAGSADSRGSETTMDLADRKSEMPSVEDLVAAFERIRGRITPAQRAMLVLSCVAGKRGVTMWELLQVCGTDIPDPKFAWQSYFELAQLWYEELGVSNSEFESLRSSEWDLVITECEPSDRDGMYGNYGVVFVIRPEVAEALESLHFVHSPQVANGQTMQLSREEIFQNDFNETRAPASEISDFVIYHNPDVMGPLEDEPTFEVFTNKSVSGAKPGDRVWLITGEGTPRKFSLACWFYIDGFRSADELGFKHCISGSEGEAFSPFVEIEQDEWFTQLKKDQGNFAFGFNQINTPGALKGLKALAGILEAIDKASVKGRRTQFGSLSLNDLAVLARLHSNLAEVLKYVKANPDDSSGYVPSNISVTEITLDRMGVYVQFDVEAWANEAKRLSGDADAIGDADLLTLRKLLTYHRHQSRNPDYPEFRELDYWIDLSLKGDLVAILGRFDAIYQEAVSDHLSEILRGPDRYADDDCPR